MSDKPVSWEERYAKWDKFEEGAEPEDEAARLRHPKQFDFGGELVQPEDRMLLNKKTVRELRKLPQPNESITWQVVWRPLRVWSAASCGAAEGEGAIPCRPFCAFVTELFPRGRVLSKHLCSPPERAPSPNDVLQYLVETMKKPPGSEAPMRPGKVVIPSGFVVASISKSLAALDVECSQLSEAEGVADCVTEFSEFLLRRDMASASQANSQQALVDQEAVTPALLRGYFAAAARFFAAQPWNRFPSTRALVLQAPAPGGEPSGLFTTGVTAPVGRVWVSVMGDGTDGAARGSTPRGLAVFFTRADLENRMLPGGKVARERGLRCQSCGAREEEAGRARRLLRCTRCRSVYYCSGDCQRSDWAQHKPGCVLAGAHEVNGVRWGLRECVVMFEEGLMLPFPDLDAVFRLKLLIPVPPDDNPHRPLFPVATTYRKGAPSTPTAEELVWCLRALHVVAHVTQSHPELPMNDDSGEGVEVRVLTTSITEGVKILCPGSSAGAKAAWAVGEPPDYRYLPQQEGQVFTAEEAVHVRPSPVIAEVEGK